MSSYWPGERASDSAMNAARRAFGVAGILTAVWVFLAGTSVTAQPLMCPGGPVDYPTGNWCGGPTPLTEWPANFCGCSSSFYQRNCWTGLTGVVVDGTAGCRVECGVDITDVPCPDDVERTGTPPSCRMPHKVSAPRPPIWEGLPVSLTTGEVFFSHSDAVIGALSFQRSYNTARLSSSRRHGIFGPGWNSSFEARLNVLSVSTIEARLPDGTPIYYFDDNADGIYGQQLPLSVESWIETIFGGYKRMFRVGGFEIYDTAGRLQTATDAAGVVTAYGRDAQGRLTTVTRLGRSVTIGYEGTSSQPARLEGPGGVLLANYGYDGQGRLEAVDYPDNGGYRYLYDSAGRIIWVKDATGNPVEAHVYDGSGRALTSEIGDGQNKLTFAYTTNRTTVTDALGNATMYDWASVQHMYVVTKVTGPCQSCGGGGSSEEWTYDAAGNITAYKDGAGKVSTYAYDSNNDLLSETDPLNRTTTYTYDAQGRVTSVSRPGGGSTTTTHGPAGPLTITEAVTSTDNRTTAVAYGPSGKPTSITDPRNKVTTMGYNAAGDLTSITDPLNHTTTFGYDSSGRRVSVTDALNNSTATTYDLRGRPLSIISPDSSHTDFTYDANGRRTKVTDPLGRVTSYVYDTYGRVTSVVDPAGGVTRYAYDVMSQLTSLTDAKAQTAAFDYDGFGRVTKVTYPGGAFETFTYDARGLLATRTDRKSVTTTYAYDDLGRLTGKAYSDATPPVTYTYDTAGLPATAGNGTDTLTWAYNLAGDLLSEASTRNASTVEYAYDAAGNRVTLGLNGAVQVTYGYDDASRLVTITRGTASFTLGYDDASRRTSLSYPNGIVTSYTYDSLSRLTNLSAVRAGAAVDQWGYTYDLAGNRTSKTSLDFTESYGYDPLYRLNAVERTGLTNRWFFNYDSVGNRTRTQAGDSVTQATFNERNQLVTASGGGPLRWRGTLNEPGTVTFTSAAINGKPAEMLPGNVFQATLDMAVGLNTVALQATDASGNVRAATYQVDVSGTTASYTYDPNGNLTHKTEGSDTWTYEWNAEDELIRGFRNGAEVVRYGYDPIGRRVEKIEPTKTTRYTYDGSDVLREIAGTQETRFVFAVELDEVLAEEDASGVLSYHHIDALGSVVARTNAAGVRTASFTFDAFGISTSSGRFGFTGREADAESGLYYYRTRYYDPRAGRFLSEDPLGWAGGLNLYGYVFNNPALLADPTGMAPWDNDDFVCLFCTVYAETRGNSTCAPGVISAIMNRQANWRNSNGNRLRPGDPKMSLCDVVSGLTPKGLPQFGGFGPGNPNYVACTSCSGGPNPSELIETWGMVNSAFNRRTAPNQNIFFFGNRGFARAVGRRPNGQWRPRTPVRNCSRMVFFGE